jgi:hypothetical protein
MRHSGNDITEPIYMGTGLVNGVLCHRWLDGTILPLLSGGDGEGDGDDGGDDGDGDDGSDDGEDGDGDGDDSGTDDGADDDDDEDGEEDDAALDKINDPDKLRTMLKGARNTAQKASRQAAKYRTMRNKARGERDSERTAHEATKTELNDLKAKGTTDDTSKATIAQLTKERDDLKAEAAKLNAAQAEAAAERTVAEEMSDLGIEGDPEYAILKLRKANLWNVDEDGDIEDLTVNLKKLVRKGVLTKKSTSGGNGANGVKSGRTNTAKGRKPNDKVDRNVLAKKYTALNR